MGIGWSPFRFWFQIYVGLISLWGFQECWSLNDEGLALLEFRARITSDPNGALATWNPNDHDPCNWLGVVCAEGRVQMLSLNGLSLEGTLAPELGKLSHLKYLMLCKNNFSGTIPKELGDLTKLELLDLWGNNFTGHIPAEIGNMLLLKHLVWQSNDNPWTNEDLVLGGALMKYLNVMGFLPFKLGKPILSSYEENCCDNLPRSGEPEIVQNVPNIVSTARRRLLDQSNNLPALPVPDGSINIITLPTTLSSGAFSAVPDDKRKQNYSPAPAPSDSSNQDQSSHGSAGEQTHEQGLDNDASGNWWRYIITIAVVAVLVTLAVVIFCLWKSKAARVISPFKTGISGQLQKAFVTGVPKLNRGELETACEDFSNIVDNLDDSTIYKGTLSSGVEIAVVSTLISSSKDWSKSMERAYRKKIDTLSRVNHKNFINLIGYCEEEEPFTRMMVVEYAPNGTLFEHLHVKEVEHLDWTARTRIIMGIAYCLQYMHHDLNPPVALTNLNSASIFLTDDFASKAAEVLFGKIVSSAPKVEDYESSKHSELPPHADPETNVYSYGILLLEIISGKLPYSKEHGHLLNWAAEYLLNDKRSMGCLIDPTLQSFKDKELDVICEVIKDCIQSDPRLRPTMIDVTSKLRTQINISPEQAAPRLSPLWWAELEILSVEAT